MVAAAGERFRGRPVTREELQPPFGQGTEADVRVFGLGDSRYDRGAAGAAGVRFVGLGLDGDARIEGLSELLAHL